MLGWRSHRQVWAASVFFFVANVNLLVAILNGYRVEKMWRSSSDTPGEGWTQKQKAQISPPSRSHIPRYLNVLQQDCVRLQDAGDSARMLFAQLAANNAARAKIGG
eukprot:scaffold1801_cov79-Skeletonema_menzelii.AAC.6